ncbi:MAG: ABC transporter [Clostridiales bacterium]|nr:ABC transporter [Clostridiales bacterium]
MIELRNVSFAFRGGAQVLKNISYAFPEGRVTAVLGPNGAGKTTLFKCMLGLYPGYTGQILLDGKDLRVLSPAGRAEKTAYIPQHGGEGSGLTVRDFVLLGAVRTLSPFRTPGPAQEKAAEDAIRELGLEPLAARPVRKLSGGERQLALIARALCQQSGILLMDEPDASLDPAHVRDVLNAARTLADGGRTVILSTHRPEYALRYADSVMLLKDGAVTARGDAGEVLTEELLTELYGTRMRVIYIDGERFIDPIP